MTHIMIDIETWGKRPGCDIRSIGAVVFDPIAGTIEGYDESAPIGERVTSLAGKFYRALENPEIYGDEYSEIYGVSKYKYPLTRDPETIKWWNEQSEEAQSAFAFPVDLRAGLRLFAECIGVTAGCTPSEAQHVRIWANDPHFDCSILAAAYHACDMVEPWHYRAPRSFRTITEAAGMTREDFKPFDHGTAHNALDDAISQARIVCEAYKRLGLKR